MKNLTIALDEPLARWVRVKAAQEDRSVSRYLGDLLRSQMANEDRYAQAMARFLARQPSKISQDGRYPTRDELHDRAGLRRQ